MSVKNITQNVAQVIDSKIPTRFDDIQKEIQQAKIEEYFKQFIPQNSDKTYSLGNVLSEELGKKLDKIG